ncbi:MAG: cyclase family protein [Thermoanaerobaculales bacterium]|jgi:kynurenine formamidase|nr:cyclase family protein [Thermoanaerobaculales bacterium]
MNSTIDLTHPISENMPVYPGTEPPVIEAARTVAEDGFLERKITLYSHTGTHVDAPAHLIKNGMTLDAFPVDTYVGPAMMLDVTGVENGIIGLDSIEPRLREVGQVDFLLIRTDWSRFWGTDQYFSGYPVLSTDAAELLAGSGLKGVGFDTISPDPVGSENLPVHRALMAAELIIVENLTGLEHLPPEPFVFSCFPLAFEDADGSPVRAVALIGKSSPAKRVL